MKQANSPNTVTVRRISKFVFEDVTGGSEPLFYLDNHNFYWHQSGYGCLPFDRVIVETEH